MACKLNSQCNFICGFFECNLPEDTIDVEVTVRTPKGVHNFRRDHATQSSMCSPWGLQVKPFPLLVRKMEVHMEERRNVLNPFSHTQIGQAHHPFQGGPLLQKEVGIKLRKNITNLEE